MPPVPTPQDQPPTEGMRNFLMPLPWFFGLLALFLVTGLWVFAGLLLLAALVFRVVWFVRLWLRGAAVLATFLGPELMGFMDAMQRSVDEGPIKSGFLGLLAFPILAVLILFAVTGMGI